MLNTLYKLCNAGTNQYVSLTAFEQLLHLTLDGMHCQMQLLHITYMR